MNSGAYDGANRNYCFQGVEAERFAHTDFTFQTANALTTVIAKRSNTNPVIPAKAGIQ